MWIIKANSNDKHAPSTYNPPIIEWLFVEANTTLLVNQILLTIRTITKANINEKLKFIKFFVHTEYINGPATSNIKEIINEIKKDDKTDMLCILDILL